MLTKKVLINSVGTEYEQMIKKISIPDFTKCVAQYSGIPIKDLKDEIIINYLSLWCKNKKYIFDLFGKEVKVDMPITYADEDRDYENKIMSLAKEYPVYYHWLNMFNQHIANKIDKNELTIAEKTEMAECFPNYNYESVSITHFFKSKLKAPDELVTAIGRIFENAEVNATYTLSIDPVDIMLSSETPYNWTSCYRLEEFEESHADGCLAGVLDGSTVTSYLWNRQGDFSLYNKYDFKNIRYKIARITLAFNRTLNAIHFNKVYPWKDMCSDNFQKLIRNKVETFICERNTTKKENIWKNYSSNDIPDLNPYRQHDIYGYQEYSREKVWILKNCSEYAPFEIYNEYIICPCGCGENYIGTDNDDDLAYEGTGHINDHYHEDFDDEYEDEEEDFDDIEEETDEEENIRLQSVSINDSDSNIFSNNMLNNYYHTSPISSSIILTNVDGTRITYPLTVNNIPTTTNNSMSMNEFIQTIGNRRGGIR